MNFPASTSAPSHSGRESGRFQPWAESPAPSAHAHYCIVKFSPFPIPPSFSLVRPVLGPSFSTGPAVCVMALLLSSLRPVGFRSVHGLRRVHLQGALVSRSLPSPGTRSVCASSLPSLCGLRLYLLLSLFITLPLRVCVFPSLPVHFPSLPVHFLSL